MTSRIGKATRSKSGCKTCRRRRKKCDEGHPKCQLCVNLGIECEGYEKPLIWGNGIASRGKFKGAVRPTQDQAFTKTKLRSQDNIPQPSDMGLGGGHSYQSTRAAQRSAPRDTERQHRDALSPGFSMELEQIIMDDNQSVTWKNSPDEVVFEKELCNQLMIDCKYSNIVVLCFFPIVRDQI